jgi:hypothetical protein
VAEGASSGLVFLRIQARSRLTTAAKRVAAPRAYSDSQATASASIANPIATINPAPVSTGAASTPSRDSYRRSPERKSLFASERRMAALYFDSLAASRASFFVAKSS